MCRWGIWVSNWDKYSRYVPESVSVSGVQSEVGHRQEALFEPPPLGQGAECLEKLTALGPEELHFQ